MLRVVENPKKRPGKSRKSLSRRKPVRRTRVIRSARKSPPRKRRVTRVRRRLPMTAKRKRELQALIKKYPEALFNIDMRTQREKRIDRFKRNPQNKFVIKAILQASGRTYFFRASTKSFVPTKSEGTLFKSQALAHRMAESIVSKLPSNIKALSIENTN